MQRSVGQWFMPVVCALSAFSVIALTGTVPFSSDENSDSPQVVCSPVLVFAAASASNALDKIRTRFTDESGIAIETSYGSSAALVRQIENGAPADVFLSADAKWADRLSERGLVAKRRNLLGNRLVLVVPNGSTLKIQAPGDLLIAGVEHLALGDPDSVPAGMYSRQALKKLGLWNQLAPKVAAAEDVRHALAFVETGAAEAGIVYATDAAISKKVKVVFEVPESLTGPVRYPLVLLHAARNNPAAESFYRYLASDEAAEIIGRYGFTVLPVTVDVTSTREE